MTFDDIKAKLHDRIDKSKEDSFTCSCPGHEDDKASLSVGKGKDGKIVLKCFAGCTPEQILKPLGLTVRDLFPDNGTHRNGAPPKAKATADPVVATYDYRDSAGKLVFQVQRRQSKKFVQRRPNGKNWIYNLDGVDRVLYRLPELLASSNDTWVLIPEGEKDVDNLRRRGYVATTNAAGANAAWLDSYSESLRGRKVCILPDNDGPGRQHANAVASHLVGVAADVRLLALPGLPVKGDVTDWLDAGNDPKTLLDLVNNAPIFKATSGPAAATADTKPVLDKGALWVEALRSTAHTFALNVLEDTVEIDGRRLDDVTRSKIYLDMIGKGISKNYVDDCINVLSGENTYHPVQRYLNGLQWDGADQVDVLLSHIRGDGRTVVCADGSTQPLHSILVFRWLLGCVARALDGDKATAFKHQTPMLVFVGGQGAGKSSFVRWLCSGIGYEFHQEGPVNPQKIEDQRSMVTKWIWEVSELGASLRRSDREAVKGFITQEWHTYRKPWGRSNITKPTLCNLVGSINGETGFLDDPTGHRRFLPVQITGLDWNYSKTVDVNQLWAQLVHLYRTGASPELTPAERTELAKIHAEHEIENPLLTYLQMYFTIAPGIGQCFTATIIQRLQAFGVNLSSNTKVAGREINDVLAPLGLTRKSISIDGIKGWGWIGIQPKKLQPPLRSDPR